MHHKTLLAQGFYGCSPWLFRLKRTNLCHTAGLRQGSYLQYITPMNLVKSLKILGIDPGIARMGWGVVEETAGKARAAGLTPDYAALEWVPKEKVTQSVIPSAAEGSRGKLAALEDALDEMEDVSEYYTNA